MWLKEAFIIGFRRLLRKMIGFHYLTWLHWSSCQTWFCSTTSLLASCQSGRGTIFKICFLTQASWENCVFLGPNVRDLFLSLPLTNSLLIWLQSGWPSAAWHGAINPGLQQSQRHTLILSLWDIAPNSAQAPHAHLRMVLINPVNAVKVYYRQTR